MPALLSELILRTAQFDTMRGWYATVLDMTPTVEVKMDPPWTDDRIQRVNFFRLMTQFPYTQTLGLFETHPLDKKEPRRAGLDHMQLRVATLEDLFKQYERLDRLGIRPVETMNHGPGTSFYYFDPDGNKVEFSGVNFDNERDYLAFFQSEAYKKNFAGTMISDVPAYMKAVRGGTHPSEFL